MQHKGVINEGICHLSLQFAGMQIKKKKFEQLEDLHPVLYLLHLSESGGSFHETNPRALAPDQSCSSYSCSRSHPTLQYAFQTCNMQNGLFVLHACVFSVCLRVPG